jgi:hypothetical protein
MNQIKSTLFSLATNDYVNAFIVAVLSPVAAVVGKSLESFSMGQPFTLDYTSLWHLALAAGVGYLIKNFFTNSQGQFLSAEPPKISPTPVQ